MKRPKPEVQKTENPVRKKAYSEEEFFAPDDKVSIQITGDELNTLFNGARALELIRQYEEADGEQKIISVAVLLDLTAEPTWEVVSDLQGRYRDAKLRAAGQLEKLEAAVSRLV